MKSVLDSRQLLAAKTLASTGSFTLAGRHLSLTQSAVSHAIRALEDQVGCRLFTRTGKGVVVTPAGKHFLEHLDRILDEMEVARTLVTPRTAAGKECLRVGVSTRAREFILPIVRPLFQKEFPNRLVVLEPGDYRNSLELLESGLLDLCFCVRPAEHPTIAFHALFEDELRFVVTPDHPWARRGEASAEDLAAGMLVVHQAFNNTGALLEAHLRRFGIRVRHAVELIDYQHLKALALTGQCAAVVPPWLVVPEIESGRLVELPIGRAPLVREWGLACTRARKLAPIDERFIALCREAVPGMLSRLRGLAGEGGEKKVLSSLPSIENHLRYGAMATAVASASSWICGISDWLETSVTLLA